MRLRAVIFDDDAGIRQTLWALCERRGYEVFTFPDPGQCPLHRMDRCPCPAGTVCADLLLADLHMPAVDGLDFLEALVAKTCSAPHLALMSGAWSEAATARAARLGCRLFTKPVPSTAIVAWLAYVETLVSPERGLLDWRAQGWRVLPLTPGTRL